MSIDDYGNEHLRDEFCRILALLPDRAMRDDALEMADRLADLGKYGDRLRATWDVDSPSRAVSEKTEKRGLVAMFGATCSEGCVWLALRREKVQVKDNVTMRRHTVDREAMLAVVRGIAEYVAKYKMIVDITCKRAFGRLPSTVLVRDVSDGGTGSSAINHEISVDRLAEVAIGGDRCMGGECFTGRFVVRRDGRGDGRTCSAIAALELIQDFAEGAAHMVSFRWNEGESKSVIEFGNCEWPAEGLVDASLEYAAKKKAPQEPRTNDEKVTGIVMGINRDFSKKCQ